MGSKIMGSGILFDHFREAFPLKNNLPGAIHLSLEKGKKQENFL
jgi:hypothetical protein